MIRWSASVFATSFVASVVLAQPAATTNPAAHDVDPAVTAFLAPVQAQSGDNELRQKLIERHNVAVKLLELRLNEYRRGLVPLSEGMAAAGAVAEAKMDLAQSDDERAKVAQQTLDVMKVAEARIEKQVQAGFGSEADLDRTRLARLNAEIELLKLKQPKQSTRDTTAPATTRP
jgi:hypothetical protein